MLNNSTHQFLVSDYLYGLHASFRYRLAHQPVHPILNQTINEDDLMYDSWLGQISICAKPVHILLQIRDWNFARLPDLYLRLPLPPALSELTKYAHFGPISCELEGNKYLSVCYSIADANELPRYSPIKVVQWIFKQTQNLVAKTLTDKGYRDSELLREIQPNWQWLWHLYIQKTTNKQSLELSSYQLILDDIPSEKLSFKDFEYRSIGGNFPKRKLPTLVLKSKKVCLSQLHVLFDTIQKCNTNLNLVHFRSFLQSLDRDLYQSFTVTFLRVLHLFAQSQERLLPVCLLLDNNPICIILSVCDGYLTADRQLKVVEEFRGHTRPNVTENINVSVIDTTNIAPQFIYRRNLDLIQMKNLEGYKLLVVGCGAIGGYLALSLARLGAGSNGGSLTLLDHDCLGAHNIGRHVLGKNYINFNKAAALKVEILSQLVGLKVIDIREDVLSGSLERLTDYDLVIDATAKTGVSEAINQSFYTTKKANSSLLHVWIRGNGEAVQSLLVDWNSRYACRTCLSESGSAFKEPFDALVGNDEQHSFLACHDYTPYSVSASLSAAALAADVALEWANQRTSPRLRTRYSETWKGNKIASFDPEKIGSCPICSTVVETGE